ncbi:hypothetical protein BLM79_005363 [Escherichia coli]|nr:hypothetical protein [Escherichia coli]
MKHTELRAAVLDALEKHDTGATFFDGRPAVFDEADFPAVACNQVNHLIPTRVLVKGGEITCKILK